MLKIQEILETHKQTRTKVTQEDKIELVIQRLDEILVVLQEKGILHNYRQFSSNPKKQIEEMEKQIAEHKKDFAERFKDFKG